jgi:hypothetical protein
MNTAKGVLAWKGVIYGWPGYPGGECQNSLLYHFFHPHLASPIKGEGRGKGTLNHFFGTLLRREGKEIDPAARWTYNAPAKTIRIKEVSCLQRLRN